jgi:sensor domain CHASE-containing protein
VFLSKIWFFLIALAAAIAFTIAFVMPRPAQRQVQVEEHARLTTACSVIDILLADDARDRVALTATFARSPDIVSALDAASGAKELDTNRMKTVQLAAQKLVENIKGRKPDFAILIDHRGRVVAQVKLDESEFGDTAAGRPLVDDALAGYLRDDLWTQKGTMYLVSGAPVIRTNPPIDYVGAVILGHKVTNELAADLAHRLSAVDTQVAFYLGGEDVAASKPLSLDHKPMTDALAGLTGGDLSKDCAANNQLSVTAGADTYTTMIARMPGEAMSHGAYYAVFAKTVQGRGFGGTLDAVRKSDLSTKVLIVVGIAFLLALGLGIGFMWIESDRPLRGLANDAVKLAKNESERLAEDAHGGKYGSIARSVNIHIDKLGRDAKSARTNLDQLLGPAPEGSLGTIDLLASALPPSRPGPALATASPPPSDFKFHDPAPAQAPVQMRAPTPAPVQQRPSAPQQQARPPAPRATPPRGSQYTPPAAHNQTQPLSLDDDILGGAASQPGPEPYFQQVYDQFVSVKKSCGENTSGLTFQKFAEKLVKNRDDLKMKTGCREVRFTVYVKDGKAALKATPVKDE